MRRLEERAQREYNTTLIQFMRDVDAGLHDDDPFAQALAMEADLLNDERWVVPQRRAMTIIKRWWVRLHLPNWKQKRLL